MFEFLEYGKYTGYIWWSYGIGVGILAAIFIAVVFEGRSVRNQLKQQIQRSES